MILSVADARLQARSIAITELELHGLGEAQTGGAKETDAVDGDVDGEVALVFFS
jgi:hypothetical protein